MKLDNEYYLDRDAHNHILRYEKVGEINPETKKPTITRSETYHTTLLQALEAYLDKVVEYPESIMEVVTLIKKYSKNVETALSKM